MKRLTVTPATLTAVADTYSSSAAEITAAAEPIGADALALSATFGMIGGEFVAAVVSCTDDHRAQIGALGAEAQGIAGELSRAGADYRGTDDGAAHTIGVAGSTAAGVA